MLLKNVIVSVFVYLLILSSSMSAQNTPDLFKRESIEKRMVEVAKWQLENPKHKLYDWTNGAFYAGVFAAYETTKDQQLLDAIIEMGDKNEWKPGPRFDHADDIVIAQTYIDVYRIKKDLKMLDGLKEAIAKLRSEKSREVEKHGIMWWWCDALFMGPPTLAKLAAVTGDRSYLDLNDKLYAETYERLWDQKEKLYARDASYLINAKGEGKRESNNHKIFWSRGNGWVAGGLARLLSELPKNHPKRKFYTKQFKDLMDRVVKLQQPDGLWRSSLLDPGAYPGGESSGSGFFIYSMAWGINNGVLDKKDYLPAIKKGWPALNGLVHTNGLVGWTQPIGADPRRNFNADSWEVYGAGAFLLAGSEVVKLK